MCTPASPEAMGKPRRTFVDAAFALDKIAQGFVQLFEFRGVPQRARPFAPGHIIVHDRVHFARQTPSRATHILVIVVRDAGFRGAPFLVAIGQQRTKVDFGAGLL
jgi:hypothetical protein